MNKVVLIASLLALSGCAPKDIPTPACQNKIVIAEIVKARWDGTYTVVTVKGATGDNRLYDFNNPTFQVGDQVCADDK